MSRARLAALLVAATITAPALAAKCSPFDFMVSDTSAHEKYGILVVVAKVTNHGALACGVEVSASSYDKSGSLIDTNNAWPASIRNIEPGSSVNFTIHLQAHRRAARFDVLPNDAREWRTR